MGGGKLTEARDVSPEDGFVWDPRAWEVCQGDADLCLHELVERQVERTPDLPAVVDGDTVYSYRQLDDKANLLASWLRSHGCRPNAVTGILMERCAAYVVAYLAALKAAPLETAYPTAMLEGVISDVKPIAVLTKEQFNPTLPTGQIFFNMDDGWEERLAAAMAPLGDKFARNEVEPTQDDLVYVVYSSGSTGKAKGILAPHRSPVHSYVWREKALSGYGPGWKVACNVFFVWECLRPLMRGGTTVVIPDDMIYDIPALADYMKQNEINEILFTPSLAQTILASLSAEEIKDKFSSLKAVLLNGEVVTTHLLARCEALLPPTCRILNVYSISECGEVACQDLRREHDPTEFPKFCSPGRPAAFVHLLILDDHQKPVPEGGIGELYIGGTAIGYGYLELPEMTVERFIKNPTTGEPLYRSGDLARLSKSGHVEILGRCNFMVKVRGYSVVLGAIEETVVSHVAVKSCLVEAVGDEGDDKRLVAYLVLDPDARGRTTNFNIDGYGACPALVAALRKHLAHYMVPWVYVVLDEIPMMPPPMNKVDRKRLPAPPAPRPRGKGLPEDFTMAHDAEEGEVVAVVLKAIEEELNLEPGTSDSSDSFFELGGHSLAASRLTARLAKIFGVKVPIKAFLEDPTAEAVARGLNPKPVDGGEMPPFGELPLPFVQVMEADSVLGEELTAKVVAVNTRHPPVLQTAQCVLVTGATGYLGGALLAELAKNTTAELRCIVRPRATGTPLEALQAALSKRGLWAGALAEAAENGKVVVIPGDLAKPRLGVSPADYNALVSDVDVIVHCGAHVNLVLPYSGVKDSNVGGTRAAIELAATPGRPRALHYVSTNGVTPWGTPDTRERVWREDDDLDLVPTAALDGGYAQSKWVAERLVVAAAALGMPAVVYRPGNLGGHRGCGDFNTSDGMMMLMGACALSGKAPAVKDWEIEMTPVDYVAAAMCAIMDDINAARVDINSTFHLAHPSPLAGAKVVDAMVEMGYKIETVPRDDWVAAVKAQPTSNTPLEGIGALLEMADGPEGEGELWYAGKFDTSRFDEAMGNLGFPGRPAIDSELIQALVKTAVAKGYMPGPPGGAASFANGSI